jgi:hypothetical protein
MRNNLIEGAVDSYNTIAKKLIAALIGKETDSETINRLYDGLKEHRKTIKRLFKDSPSLEIYKPEIRKVLKEIRDNKDIFKTLLSAHSIEEEDISDYYDGTDYVVEINGEYDLENFILRRMEAGAIIIGKSLPTQIIRLFDKVKELYMFGSYEATIVFCRALIEETLKNVYHSQHPKTRKRRIDNMSLYDLLNGVKFPNESPNLKDELDAVRKAAKLLIHRAMFNNISTQTINVKHGKCSFPVKKKDIGSIEKSALSAIRASTRAIEVFFA